MAGNLWEWCLNTYDHPESPESLYIEPYEKRVLRGGSWSKAPESLRVSNRNCVDVPRTQHRFPPRPGHFLNPVSFVL